MHVPFIDLKAHHQGLRAEFETAIREVIDSGAFASGPYVVKFESDFAAYCECPYAVGVGSGTEAIWFTLLALGVGPGDEVITVPHTFMATAEAISFTGARPVFVDIDEQTYTMAPHGLERAITPRTKAIIPVHIFGQTADMDPILDIAAKHDLPVIEDASQAHGAQYKGRKAGSLGIAGCFSFYPGKNLGAFGEAGAVVTHSKALQEKIQALRDHGQVRKYDHAVIGWNGRMDGIQAAVLQIKLKHLDRANAARRAKAALYKQCFDSCEQLVTPREADYSFHVYHLYAIRIRNRNTILQELAKRGIACGIHYPIPIHLQEAYKSLGYAEGSFPVAERCAKEFLSLPMFPELTNEQIERVSRQLIDLLKDSKAICESVT